MVTAFLRLLLIQAVPKYINHGRYAIVAEGL